MFGIWDFAENGWLAYRIEFMGTAVAAFETRQDAEDFAANVWGYNCYAHVVRDKRAEVRPLPPTTEGQVAPGVG